jgi:transposase
MKRKKYNQEFKDDAVKLVTEHGYQIPEAARNLGIHPSLLGRWKQQHLPHLIHAVQAYHLPHFLMPCHQTVIGCKAALIPNFVSPQY